MAASEAGHWYSQDGTPVFEVMGSKGKLVKANLTHARKLGLLPGITTILKVAAKPQLTTWLRRQSILAALTLPRHESETEDQWLDRVTDDADSIGGAAAEEGTRIHAAIERSFLGQSFDPNYTDHVLSVRLLLQTRCGEQSWSPEKSFASPLGYGSKADLHCPQWIIDFKGKDGDQEVLDALDLYDDHYMQLAATKHGLGYESAKCAIVYVSRTHPGACSFVEAEPAKLDTGYKMFQCLLSFWRLKNNYDCK